MTNLYDETPYAKRNLQVNLARKAAILGVQSPTFNLGDRVYKKGGGYQAWGQVVEVLWTTKADERVVFEFEEYPGMLHIFSPNQLSRIGPEKSNA